MQRLCCEGRTTTRSANKNAEGRGGRPQPPRVVIVVCLEEEQPLTCLETSYAPSPWNGIVPTMYQQFIRNQRAKWTISLCQISGINFIRNKV